MNSDVTPGEQPRLVPIRGWPCAAVHAAPIDGSYELWRIAARATARSSA